MDLTSLAVLILGVTVWLALELRRIEARLAGPDDREHDDAVERETSKELESYRRHLEELQHQKFALPQTNLWAIASTPNWEQDLIAKAEPLRKLIEEIHGSTPDSYFVSQRVAQVPMTYNLAHALAELALARKEISIRRAEWSIKKIEVLGLQRQRNSSLRSIAYGERELLDLEQEILERGAGLSKLTQDVMQSYDAALGPIEQRLDG